MTYTGLFQLLALFPTSYLRGIYFLLHGQTWDFSLGYQPENNEYNDYF
ncbi:hypothetical protein [Moorena sp. SIO3H5]|nr:hypothetical protein [Moorena sp. SIO3H5]NEO69805.1 hypothetical protein [Moorena sp. SIO3H5]